MGDRVSPDPGRIVGLRPLRAVSSPLPDLPAHRFGDRLTPRPIGGHERGRCRGGGPRRRLRGGDVLLLELPGVRGGVPEPGALRPHHGRRSGRGGRSTPALGEKGAALRTRPAPPGAASDDSGHRRDVADATSPAAPASARRASVCFWWAQAANAPAPDSRAPSRRRPRPGRAAARLRHGPLVRRGESRVRRVAVPWLLTTGRWPKQFAWPV
jgi:hypothetical protein